MASQGHPIHKINDIISTFRPTKRFRPDDQKTSVTSLDFDDTGELAIIARNDDTLQIYNCKEGKHAKELKSQKYGVHLARFTHHAQSILYASTKVDDTIRYLSTHDNSYIRYYRGHTAPVTCITLCPSSDTFMSCSLDDTVRLWSLNSQNAQGILKLRAPSLAAYDPSASVIAVASPSSQTVLLYDLRNYDKPPFASFDLGGLERRLLSPQSSHQKSLSDWTKIEFTNDGKSILVGTAGAGHFLIDAFDGSLRHFLAKAGSGSLRTPPSATPSSSANSTSDAQARPALGQGDICLSPDGRYAIEGGGLLVWDLHSAQTEDRILRPSAELPGPGRQEVVGYNHRMNLICSADKDMLIWLPDGELAP
ncbi:WD repeat-containing protein-like protein [Eremomyces bilateralis CBS 781.70]|uniref:WD repeat-containing protein-like protein n=1 Tax=Eremomyces bilateralis CBS 781.70 TaxID=1392243 RepID=A0A6G1GBB8_9PEZI|nr:WD repeat-containing protein-like protein [Eremomyces bilateralis CBS 781.70]KAF1815200.1 WD repeat-containing protein-like protein [Eremomyces bilateralis CBS 781.70]